MSILHVPLAGGCHFYTSQCNNTVNLFQTLYIVHFGVFINVWIYPEAVNLTKMEKIMTEVSTVL